jgi:hypothetical protein
MSPKRTAEGYYLKPCGVVDMHDVKGLHYSRKHRLGILEPPKPIMSPKVRRKVENSLGRNEREMRYFRQRFNLTRHNLFSASEVMAPFLIWTIVENMEYVHAFFGQKGFHQSLLNALMQRSKWVPAAVRLHLGKVSRVAFADYGAITALKLNLCI